MQDKDGKAFLYKKEQLSLRSHEANAKVMQISRMTK